MYLYVANVTKQNWTVFYRTDIAPPGSAIDFRAPGQQAIPAANPRVQQATVGGDLEEYQCNLVIKQLSQYGMIADSDLPNGLRGVHPLICNVGQPVSERAQRMVIAHNQGMKLEEGAERRERAAIGANAALSLAAQNADLPEPQKLDVEFEQMDDVQGENRIESGFHVERNLAAVPPRAKKPKVPPRPVGRPRKAM